MKHREIPKYPLETLILFPLFAWMSDLVLLILVLERAHPILPLLFLLPAWDAGGKRIGSLRARAQDHPAAFYRFSGLHPQPLYSRAGLRTLAVMVLILAAVTAAIVPVLLAARSSSQSNDSVLPLVLLFAVPLATVYVYRPFMRRLQQLVNILGFRGHGLLPVLASTVLVWLIVDVVFADLYQRLWDLCSRAPPAAICHNSAAFSSDVGTPLNALYFSTATLATVGYGDIAPVAPAARVLVILEIVLGVSLLVFMVGRVVSYSPRRPSGAT